MSVNCLLSLEFLSAQSGVFVCSVWSFCLQKSAVFWSGVHESVRYLELEVRFMRTVRLPRKSVDNRSQTADCQTPLHTVSADSQTRTAD